jgi:hypothetical protein
MSHAQSSDEVVPLEARLGVGATPPLPGSIPPLEEPCLDMRQPPTGSRVVGPWEQSRQPLGASQPAKSHNSCSKKLYHYSKKILCQCSKNCRKVVSKKYYCVANPQILWCKITEPMVLNSSTVVAFRKRNVAKKVCSKKQPAPPHGKPP